MPEAATPTGGAAGSVRAAPAVSAKATPSPQPAQSQQTQQAPRSASTAATQDSQSIQDRIKASLFGAPSTEPEPDEGRAVAPPVADEAGGEAPAVAPDGEQQVPPDDDAAAVEATAKAEADEAAASIKSIKELAEGLGWESDRVMDLEVPVKINGKESTVPLREALKSYQLEGHLNQGLTRLAEDRKGFEAETARKVGEINARVGQLSQAVTLAQKILDGEFADVNWDELQRTDPGAFQAKFGAREMRLAAIRNLNSQVMQEQERGQAQQQADYQSYLAEQGKLLAAKVPEWSDTGKRDKDVTEMVAILADAYGLTEQEVRSLVDHRQILVVSDAVKWQKLQKGKPAVLNKVRAAPKLIRPGSQQSRSAQSDIESQKDRAKLRSTGKVQDASAVLKRLLYSSN